MQIGVVYPQTELPTDPGTVRAYVQRVEQLGFRHLLVYDHVLGADPAAYPGWSGPYDIDTTFHEPLVFYGFLAAITTMELVTGIIIAQTTIAAPFVVVTVGASLANFDRTLMRAAAISGARPSVAFRRVMLPLILPGVLSGAAFAFVASFDELVIALFLAGPAQRTLPMQMFVGLREHLDPTITAAATLMMALSILLLIVADRLRR